MRTHYQTKELVASPIVANLQKRFGTKQNSIEDNLFELGATACEIKYNLTTMNRRKLNEDSNAKRNNLTLENVLLERNMASWKTKMW